MTFDRDELSRWRQARRYAVPRWMIEQATGHRLAGDWQGACAAAAVDVAFDPALAEKDPELADDLRHLVPELLRWHLPRSGNGGGTLGTHHHVTLARYGDTELRAFTPELSEGPQRLKLDLVPAHDEDDDPYLITHVDWTSARHFWDARHTAGLHDAADEPLPDRVLLDAGLLTPDDLHPLVREALFPGLPPGASGPPEPVLPEPVRVRCGGAWHQVVSGGGSLRLAHSDDEQRRERAMRALGGAVSGCFAVEQSWTSGEGRLPRKLRAQRWALFLHAQHGDTPAVLRLLDAGVDPRLRDGRQRSLLHMLHLVDHTLLLPRLLAAGLDVNGLDYRERTPLHHAVASYGSPALIDALRAAGGAIDVTDWEGWSLADLIRRRRRRDLVALRNEIERTYPGLGLGEEIYGEDDDWGTDDDGDDD
ncbi:ankyrin repeat domain-containing protein [Herbidospora galbida]|uniref:Ankyrin repeat domain-containing protein n=1 Tax=Herbidospora galbida TaxID=2575442 RepID=A0A4U3M8U8_9ACTN|nr:ankyrin repeat domain-containing protein [Herbidospora galbida]TKK85395.1 ankyrin repeat domain-containing protein [Herbidospora galbida]